MNKVLESIENGEDYELNETKFVSKAIDILQKGKFKIKRGN